MAGKAIDILTSETVYATALAADINAFYKSIQTDQKMREQSDEPAEVKKTHRTLIDQVLALEKKTVDNLYKISY